MTKLPEERLERRVFKEGLERRASVDAAKALQAILDATEAGPELWHRDKSEREGRGPEDAGASGKRGKVMVSGMHHAAWVCKDMDKTVAFYEAALGMRLRSIFPMVRVETGCPFLLFEFLASYLGPHSLLLIISRA